LSKKIKVEKIILFGSALRGKCEPILLHKTSRWIFLALLQRNICKQVIYLLLEKLNFN